MSSKYIILKNINPLVTSGMEGVCWGEKNLRENEGSQLRKPGILEAKIQGISKLMKWLNGVILRWSDIDLNLEDIGGSDGKAMGRPSFDSWVRKIPWRR